MIRHKVKQFLKFAKENNTNKKIKFAINEFSDDKYSELVVIRLYYDKEVLLFEPPTPPSRPLEVEKTDSSVTLTWTEPQQGAQFVDLYCIYFREADDDKWTEYSTVEYAKSTKIGKLKAKTGYLFKVTASIKTGTTIESQVSEVIYTAEKSEIKSGRKNKSTKSNNTSSENQVTLSKIEPNGTLGCSKETTTTLNQKQANKAPESKTAPPPQVTKTHSQHAFKKGNEKGTPNVPASYVSSKINEPKGSIIKQLYQANKCERLKESSPSIYKLNAAYVHLKDTDLELFNFGRCNEQLHEKVILLVGATGAGKTTLINGMINYIYEVKWEDPERVALAEISVDKKGAIQAVSQTNSVSMYKINHSKHGQLSYNLTIIDTPGFEDTDGLSKDQTIMTKVKALLNSNDIIDHIDGIGFVVQAPLSRLTPTQSYIIHSVYSLFGNDVANNIFVLATFSDAVSTPHVESALKEASIQYNKMFKFNNSALFANMSKKDDNYQLNSLLWKMGIESFNTFFRELEAINPVSLTLTKDVLEERKRLQVLLDGLQAQINHEFLNMQKLEHEEQLLKKYKIEAEKNENFQYQVLLVHKELVMQYRPATNCSQCQVTCHRNCWESYNLNPH